MQSKSGIYEILNTVNGKRYIGQASNFAERWKRHRMQLARGEHHSKYLQRAWDKQNGEGFQFRIILLCARDRSVLRLYEQCVLDAYAPEYNSAPVAGSNLGMRFGPERSASQSEISKQMWADNYDKMCAAVGGTQWKNKTGHTEYTKKKISQTKRGVKINYPKTRKSAGPRPDHVKKKIADAQRGKPRPQYKCAAESLC